MNLGYLVAQESTDLRNAVKGRYLEIRDGLNWYVWGFWDWDGLKPRIEFLKEHRLTCKIHPK